MVGSRRGRPSALGVGWEATEGLRSKAGATRPPQRSQPHPLGPHVRGDGSRNWYSYPLLPIGLVMAGRFCLFW